MIVPQQENPLQPRQSPLASTGSIFKIGEVTTYTPATIDAPASFRVIFQSKQDDFDMDFPTSLYQEARNRYVHLLNLCRLLFISITLFDHLSFSLYRILQLFYSLFSL